MLLERSNLRQPFNNRAVSCAVVNEIVAVYLGVISEFNQICVLNDYPCLCFPVTDRRPERVGTEKERRDLFKGRGLEKSVNL